MNCAAATPRSEPAENGPCGSEQPRPGGVGVGGDVGGRFNGIGAEQLSRPSEQIPNLVELLLQRRISHILTLPSAAQSHNSPLEQRTRYA